ncbi:2-iminoacetate synthase ThiH [candidate division LCP-89 bacterium B3_LCP]|uniref:2-iminoacetate synthase ThiH n=1 Tax=candidate division LCP-89 bacterium B3_LCP TaxID=2012998 RepID=A0A532V2N9_UNCL8|nr:MAG: 2-iminoacetate synthase ThiH [candidate division LCP-89 bacterium B3_LCP]
MSFTEILDRTDISRLVETIAGTSTSQVEAVLGKAEVNFSDFLALLSPAGENYLEEMAEQAQAITLRRFGRVILLYAPLYLSNVCSNSCVYCGFNVTRDVPRITLDIDEILSEAAHLKKWGFGHVLLVSGEAPKVLPVARLREIIQALSLDFPSLSLEIYPLSGPAYAQMAEAGADGLTLYQETYDRQVYASVHPRGKKRDFNWRLEAVERAGDVGFRRIGIGSLLGLNDWRWEGIALALHADYLMKRYWQTQITISFPRLRNIPGDFQPAYPVNDTSLVQLMLALRLFLNDAGFVISTREPASLRDHLIPLCVTQMSAGSRTEPGGYRHPVQEGAQFVVEDQRWPEEVAAAILKSGYEPVWKDWDYVMHEGSEHADHHKRDVQGSV